MLFAVFNAYGDQVSDAMPERDAKDWAKEANTDGGRLPVYQVQAV